jgi:hypothetical protein
MMRTKAVQMNPAASQSSPTLPYLKISGLAIIWFGIYALAVFGLAVLFYRFLLNQMWLVPLLAEIILIKSAWTVGPFWRGLAARFVGLVIGNTLAHFLYVIPVIYEGKEPWSEEAVWAYVIVAAQTSVAAVVLFIIRRLLRKKQPATSWPGEPR